MNVYCYYISNIYFIEFRANRTIRNETIDLYRKETKTLSSLRTKPLQMVDYMAGYII